MTLHFLELKVPPPVVAILLALGMYFGSKALSSAHITLPMHTLLGGATCLAGIAVNAAGLLSFRRHRTTANPLQPRLASTLVRDGVYRFTRNPMYLGIALILLGWGIFLSNALAMTGPLLLVAWLTRFQIIPEERALKRSFPKDFDVYARTVRRWL
jgi:protein-S-isoprenylcysteine O-methyltransferase Ste14